MGPLGPPPPELAAAAHPWLAPLLWAAAGAYALGFAVTLLRPRAARAVLAAGVVLHLAATVARGVAIDFFPLTNKMESFNAAALAMGIVATVAFRPARVYLVPLLAVLGAAMATALAFPGDLALAAAAHADDLVPAPHPALVPRLRRVGRGGARLRSRGGCGARESGSASWTGSRCGGSSCGRSRW